MKVNIARREKAPKHIQHLANADSKYLMWWFDDMYVQCYAGVSLLKRARRYKELLILHDKQMKEFREEGKSSESK